MHQRVDYTSMHITLLQLHVHVHYLTNPNSHLANQNSCQLSLRWLRYHGHSAELGRGKYLMHFEITGYPCNVIGSQRCDL